jgi:hypothetical protein
MQSRYFEELAQYEAREADRRMLFAALRQRRAHTVAQRVFSSIFWLLGVTR